MKSHLPILLSLAVTAVATRAQDAVTSQQQFGDWLKPTSTGETVKTTSAPAAGDPFTVVPSGALNQDKSDVVYTRQMVDALSLSCETSTVTLGNDSALLSHAQKTGFQFKPTDQFIFAANFHSTVSDLYYPAQSVSTNGVAMSATSQLPTKSTVIFGLSSDGTTYDAPTGLESRTSAWDAQIKQPLGSLPLTAQLKGHFEETTSPNAAPTSVPSLEQSLVWKPLTNTTFQAGLRQQQYQEYPGVDHELNEALFADWSQQMATNVSWHSYAEILNSKGLTDQAPASQISSGANGTAQQTTPGNNTSLTSSLPISMDDQTVTFSTGPSFKLQQDMTANLEFSNRWDKNPAAGTTGAEQRVSVSVKGSF